MEAETHICSCKDSVCLCEVAKLKYATVVQEFHSLEGYCTDLEEIIVGLRDKIAVQDAIILMHERFDAENR